MQPVRPELCLGLFPHSLPCPSLWLSSPAAAAPLKSCHISATHLPRPGHILPLATMSPGLLATGCLSGLASAHHHPNAISLPLVSLHPVTLHPHPPPHTHTSVLNTVDPGLTATPQRWLVRNLSSPPQARLRSQTLSGWRPAICLYRPSGWC